MSTPAISPPFVALSRLNVVDARTAQPGGRPDSWLTSYEASVFRGDERVAALAGATDEQTGDAA